MKCEYCKQAEATHKVILPDKITISENLALYGSFKELNLCRECWDTYKFWHKKLEETK